MLMCVPQSEQIWEILKDIFKDLYSDRKNNRYTFQDWLL